MSKTASATFEHLLEMARQVPLPEDDANREVQWCDERHILGISRQHGGGFEIFLCGDELRASTPLVQRHLEFDHWTRSIGEVFQANRLVLPAEDHYIPIVAFLAEELLRCNVSESLARGFAQTEPLIEMALRRIALSEEELLGLLGELRFLEALLIVAISPRQRAIALDSWRGYERGARDFVVGRRAVEVKATRGDRSLHKINSVMQVDPRRLPSNEPQEELYLLSFGFKLDNNASGHGTALSIPNQVDSILGRLSTSSNQEVRSEFQTLFLGKVASYGGSAGGGYEHEEMRNWNAYQTGWQHGFVRIYDMADSAVQVLRREDIQRRGHVVLDSVSFDIDLPERITGDLNPGTDLLALAKRLIE